MGATVCAVMRLFFFLIQKGTQSCVNSLLWVVYPGLGTGWGLDSSTLTQLGGPTPLTL